MWRCSPLEGPHHLAQQTLQVEDLLHQETLDRRLLAAGRVDALSRLPPHQDFVLELWDGGAGDSGRDTHTHPFKSRGFDQQEAQMFGVNTLLRRPAEAASDVKIERRRRPRTEAGAPLGCREEQSCFQRGC